MLKLKLQKISGLKYANLIENIRKYIEIIPKEYYKKVGNKKIYFHKKFFYYIINKMSKSSQKKGGAKKEYTGTYRHFTLHEVNGKEVEIGTADIKDYQTPLNAAKKLLSSYCRHEGIKSNERNKINITFTIRETTRGHSKIYGPYKGKFVKYDKPLMIKLKSGKIIKRLVKPMVKLAKGNNNKKMVGGSNKPISDSALKNFLDAVKDDLTYDHDHNNNNLWTQLYKIDIDNKFAKDLYAETLVSFSPDGTKIVSGSKGHKIRILLASTGEELLSFQGTSKSGQNDGKVNSVSFSPDGSKILLIVRYWGRGKDERFIQILDATNCTLLRECESKKVKSASFSPDGTKIVLGLFRSIEILDETNLKSLRTLNLEDNFFVNSVSFSPDGTKIVACYSYLISIWNANNGTKIDEFQSNNKKWIIRSVSFSPDGKKILSRSNDMFTGHEGTGLIEIWNINDRKVTFNGELKNLWSVSFSPDASMIVTSSAGIIDPKTLLRYLGSFIIIWDVTTGEVIQKIYNDGEVKSVLFSPDGTKIVSRLNSNSILMFENYGKDLSNLDVSKVTNMSNLFNNFDFEKAKKKYNIDITKWNVRNVTDMSSMFKDCKTFNQDLNKWNVSNVTDMSYMFNNNNKN